MSARRISLLTVRVALPLVLFVVGVVLIIVGHARTSAAGAGVVLLGTALMVVLIDWLARLGISSGPDREREEAARQYFDRTGHWPDEGAR
ncbi:MAG: DUF6903 family protein [Solirubrobacteraceae bacterium]|jgi:uncharacterized membrane protein YoaK (UPF0700 family)